MLCCKRKYGKKKLPNKNTLDTNILAQNYRFSKQELQLYKQRFERMARGNGFTVEDFRENMGLLGLKSTRHIADRIFSVMDRREDGKVTLTEYLDYMDILIHGSPQEKAHQSFKLITKNKTISYGEFTNYLISVWKMYNTLTGSEVNATSETIRRHFDLIDKKKDEVIDLEEYTESMCSNNVIFEWFDFVNREVADNVNPTPLDHAQDSKFSYMNALEELEQQVTECLQIIQGETEVLKVKSFPVQNKFYGSLPSLQRTFHLSPAKIFADFEQEKEDVPDIILEEEKLPLVPEGDLDSHPEVSCETGKMQVPQVKLSTRFSNESSQATESGENKVELVKGRLQEVLRTISFYREAGLEFQNQNALERKETWNLVPHRVNKKKSVIHWGDDDWNFILHMMLGIHKSVKSCAANLDATCEVQTAEFLERTKHNLLPGDSKKTTFKFRDYAPAIFERIRRLYDLSASDYLKSLGVEKIMQSLMANEFSSLHGQCSTGKSGSFFYFTDDGKYMLKTLSKEEFQFLRKILSDYYLHILKNPHTLITRFFGLYKIIQVGSREQYFVVMSNLFKGKYELNELYDLKGSTYKRSTSKEEDKSVARKDLDFNESGRKLSIGRERKQYIVQQIERDIEMLRDLKINDYSLLVGIHFVQRKTEIRKCEGFVPFAERDDGGMLSQDGKFLYFIGIIDILTKYGTRKKIEHFAKGTMFGKKKISCIPPKDYATRFYAYIESVFE